MHGGGRTDSQMRSRLCIQLCRRAPRPSLPLSLSLSLFPRILQFSSSFSSSSFLLL